MQNPPPLFQPEIWLAGLDTSLPARQLVKGTQPRISSDGDLLSYVADETGAPEVYVYYRAPGYMMRAMIVRHPELNIARRDTLFRDDFEQRTVQNYDVFPNGEERLMIHSNGSPVVHAGVVFNWPALLRRRPVTR
jgi:hypothetical protein